MILFHDYGFTFTEKHDEQLPQCVVCFKTLSNTSMKGEGVSTEATSFEHPPAIH